MTIKQQEFEELEAIIIPYVTAKKHANSLVHIIQGLGYSKAPELEARIRELENVLEELKKYLNDQVTIAEGCEAGTAYDDVLDKMTELTGGEENVCEWKESEEEYGVYKTNCEYEFCTSLYRKPLPENNICPYCRKPIKIKEGE